MIAAFSTSSPQASVALIDPDGEVIAADQEWAPTGASGACLRLLAKLLGETKLDLKKIQVFAADLGPGSFTGVKVGVTLAKTLAFANSTQAAGASSFDLIAFESIVVLPSKRGEWFVRRAGQAALRSADLPSDEFIGYGPGIEPVVYPHAMRFAALVSRLKPDVPERLVPEYLIEPSISVPKQPYRTLNQ